MDHTWKFVRVGGVDQVVIRDGADIARIPELDQKLWVALAMPKKIAGIPEETLDYLDADHDGRIRAPEISLAVAFLCDRLVDLTSLSSPGDSIPLDSITPEPLKSSARWMLALAGKPDARAIGIAELEVAASLFGAQRFNGDGVMPPVSAGEDSAAKALIEDILACLPGVPDAGGTLGVDAATLDTFVARSAAHISWMEAFAANPILAGFGSAAPTALGSASRSEDTSTVAAIHAAVSALSAVRAKIDDFFLRCSLAALDGSGGAGIMNLAREEDLQKLLRTTLTETDPDLLAMPLAKVTGAGILDLSGPFNPSWTKVMAGFRETVVGPVLGTDVKTLVAASWEDLKSRMTACSSWAESKPEGSVGSLGLARLKEISRTDAPSRLRALIAEDSTWMEKRNHLEEMRTLLAFRRDLPRIINNFVNFSEFYNRKDLALFQAGTLYMDGRACTLCIEVDDPGKHGSLAGMSATCLAYCACTRPDGAKKTIVAAFTAGSGDTLFVGRNGVFYDREGLDWDATIAKLIAQPISIREAFWSPYRWLGRTLEDLISKRAQAADTASQAKLKGASETTVAAVADGKKTEPPKKIEVGTVAAIGVALGSLGAMVTGILAALLGLGIWMPAGILGALLMISGPSMLLAWFKLRRRNLGPILDASGWAINSRIKINVPFGRSLTYVATLPRNAERSLVDPYAGKKRPWRLLIILGLIVILGIVWIFGGFESLLPESMWFSTLTGR